MPSAMLWAPSWRSTATRWRCVIINGVFVVTRLRTSLGGARFDTALLRYETAFFSIALAGCAVQIVQLDDERGEISTRSTFDHPYPATRVMWAPEAASREKDLLATAGDYLRLWQVMPDGETKIESLLNNVRFPLLPTTISSYLLGAYVKHHLFT